MMNIFKRKKPKLDVPATDLKNYRFFGDEMEVLGSRLDAARRSLEQSQTKWAQWYWQEAVDRLMVQWKNLPVLHDAGAQMTQMPRWHIEYDFWEREYENYGIGDKLFDTLFRGLDLNHSWERSRNERLQKCQC